MSQETLADREQTQRPSLRGTTARLTGVRKVIARRMVEALQTSAQLTTVVEVDLEELVALRRRVLAAVREKSGVKLTYLPLIARAVLDALPDHPSINASLDEAGQNITYHDVEHLGIAVDTPKGLVVPVVHDAGALDVVHLAAAVADVADRARNGRLTPDDVRGATFTITNTGSRGALFDTPIVNPPQSAILGTGAVVQRPVAVHRDGEVVVEVHHTAHLSLSYDHRLVDGADAARFLSDVRSRLEAADLGDRLGSDVAAPEAVVPVFFLSDSTGISAETMGNALLIQFPDLHFERTVIPFITTVEEARRVVARLDAAMEGPVTPLAFSTTAVEEIRLELQRTACPLIDFFGLHMGRVESVLGVAGMRVASRLHGVGDIRRYNARMAAVEYAIEHDDGQSLRALEKADVVLIAPSRCGKTPTTMYLALQHGLFVANYPLVDEDLASSDLPRPVRALRDRCFGITTSPQRLSQVREERRAGSPYASLEQCTYELRRAESLYASHGIPVVDSSTKSVEEMSTVVLQTFAATARFPEDTVMTVTDADNASDATSATSSTVRWFADLGMGDLEAVGGKNASLGEMVRELSQLGVHVPDGFATTAEAFRAFTAQAGVADLVAAELKALDTEDVAQLAVVGRRVRAAVLAQPFPAELESDIRAAYDVLVGDDAEASVAVRSSATAEDLPDASFAGQQETFLNIRGVEAVLQAVKEVFASLYNDRAIAYRVHHSFDHDAVALSAGVQRMVRSDVGASGVMFTMDTESGFDDAVFVTSSYGLGEGVVQGAVNPDEFYVYKPALRAGRPAVLKRGVGSKATKMVYTGEAEVGRTTAFVDVDPAQRRLLSLTDAEVEELARQALLIEDHYGRPMDIEWGKDGVDGGLYILQARPETVRSREGAGSIVRYRLSGSGPVVAEGRAIGQRIGAGAVRVMDSVDDMASFTPGDVLVADMTDPDWEPIMKRAAAIITDRGGRTCHAAIIARELGIPAVVGTGSATRDLADGRPVTVSCAQGDTGFVYDGILDFAVEETRLDSMPEVGVKIMMNVGTPDQAFSFSRLPHRGVGLARLEFVINRQVGIHPRALLEADSLREPLAGQVRDATAAYPSPRDFFVSRVAEGVAMLAAAFAPEPVIVRLSDFKSNEYANLLGGELYEPHEENPMIGYRGASRYLSADFAECFAMECEALRHVRSAMGLSNVKIMIPFVRTVAELQGVVELLARHGLRRGEDGLEVVMMCEVPSNAVLADAFLDHVDGFSIGSNDLTQLTLGLDRDSALVAGSFDERDPAVKALIAAAVKACKARGKYVGICGQGPSDHPDLAEWLMGLGIDSISLNPDTVVETWLALSKKG